MLCCYPIARYETDIEFDNILIMLLSSKMKDIASFMEITAEIQPTTAQRCRSETEKKNILEDLFSLVLLQMKKYHPSGNLNLII